MRFSNVGTAITSFALTTASLSACGNVRQVSVTTNLDVLDTAASPTAKKAETSCVAPGKVLTGVEYMCADGTKRKGTFLAATLPECRADGESGCIATSRFRATDMKAATRGAIKAGVTLAGVKGTLTFHGPADCAVDGETDCVSTSSFPAVEKMRLAAGVLKSGVMVAGIVGEYPSLSFPLAGADSDLTDLTDLSSSSPAGTYEFFDSAGVRRVGEIIDQGLIVPGLADLPVLPPTGLMRSVVVKGDANLLAVNVKSGVSLFGVPGAISGVPATCTSDGQSGCVASASFPAANVTGLAPKVLSGQAVAGVAGEVTLPPAASVLSSATFGAGGATSGTLGTCSAMSRTGCYAGLGWTGVETPQLVAGIVKSGTSLGGVTGDYPSSTYPLPGASGTDLPSLAASVSAGIYQFWKQDGTRVTGSITDAGTVTPGTTTQNFTASLYRQFSVAGDAALVAGNIRSGATLFSVVGSVTLPSASTVRSGTSYGVAGNGTSGSLANCGSEGAQDCVADGATSYRAAGTTGLASKVLSTASVAGITGNVTLPASTDVKSGVQYGVSGTGATGSYSGPADCTADGDINCRIPSQGTLKAAETANFTGWDIRRKRDGTTGAILTFAGVAGQSKTCRNRAQTSPVLYDNTASPAASGLDVFDTIDDNNNAALGLPLQIPAWTVINATDRGRDFACGGIYATGNTATGNTGADSSLAHDADGNWQDLTPGTLPGGSNSTNTANGCNASDKHCVFRELISGLMVTEVSATTDTWANAITYCNNLGEAGGAVTSPIPVIGGTSYSDWRLPTQKELMSLSNGGVRGLNQTSNLTTYFGSISTSFWSSTTLSTTTTWAWAVALSSGTVSTLAKTNTRPIVCVR